MRSFSEFVESFNDDYERFVNDRTQVSSTSKLWGVYKLSSDNYVKAIGTLDYDYSPYANNYKYEFLGVVQLTKEQRGLYVALKATPEQKAEFGNDIIQLYSPRLKTYVGVFKIDYAGRKLRELDNDAYVSGKIKWSKPFSPYTLRLFTKV